jgi:hypothetical protein
MPRSAERLGDKLGPRFVDLAVQATLAARRGLAPHEARVRQAATQSLIDRAGAEVADHFAPMLAPLLRGDHGELHPDMHAFLSRAAAGTHQWHSLSGLLGSGVQSALSGAISNAVYPIVAEINSLGPNLNADPQVWAAGVAAGVADYGTGQEVARKAGLGGSNFGLYVDLAANVPGADVLSQLVNRGLLSEEEAEGWLRRAATPEALRGPVMALRRLLLSPADAALASLRGTMAAGPAQAVARANGMTDADFAVLVGNTGEPLGLMQLLEAFRRKIITEETLRRGIRESRVRDEWADTAIALRYEPMSVADAADAALRGHLTEDQAQAIAELNGLRPQDWPAYWANQGNPPADLQLLELHRRGFITGEQVDAGLRQGRLRDTWIPAIKNLAYERLGTADAVDAWLRGHLTRDAVTEIAVQNGLTPADVPALLADAGDPLALEQLLEARRRGFITEDRLVQGLKEGRLRDDWIGTAIQLRSSPMTTAEAIGASIQGYLTRDQAAAIGAQNGLEAADFGPLYDSAGEPLSRTELEQLYNRGLISAEVVRQGLRESRLKDRYVDDALQLHVRLPEPRQVIEALTDGVVTREAAVRLLGDYGYQPDVVTMLIATAEVKSTGPHRQLVVSEISQLYADRIISEADATSMLRAEHYTGESAALILRLADYQLQRVILNSGLAAIKAHYLAGRIDEVTATAQVHALGLPASASATYLRVWGLDKLAHPKQLSEAQIVKAHTLGLFTPAKDKGTPEGKLENDRVARGRLVSLGYSEADAQLLLDGA